MQKLSKPTKLKLIMPLIYWVAANVLFFTLFSGTANQWIGIITTNIAFVFWIIARMRLGNAFSIAPKTNFLVTTGLYSKLRHPVYYFSILALVGVCVFIGNPFLALAVIGLVLLEWFRIAKEDALLAKKFGKEYTAYRKQTWF